MYRLCGRQAYEYGEGDGNEAGGYAGGLGHDRVGRGEEHGPPQNGYGGEDDYGGCGQKPYRGGRYADDLAGQKRHRGIRVAGVEVQKQHREAQAKAHDHADSAVLLALKAQYGEDDGGHDGAGHGAEAEVEAEEQRGRGAHKCELGGGVDGKGHLAQHDERGHHAGQDAQQRGGDERGLHKIHAEKVLGVFHKARQR